jgi:hypothetical protein
MSILHVPVPGALNGHVDDADERPLKANKWPSVASASAIEAADDKTARRISG